MKKKICEVCGADLGTVEEEMPYKTYMCVSCYEARNKAWDEREKLYRNPDGTQKPVKIRL